MLQQKVVIRVSMNCSKSRTKAMKIAVSVLGVTSAEIQGHEKNQIAVTGEGIDSIFLTKLIRKKVGFTELISVTPIQEITEEENENTEVETANEVQPMVWTHWQYSTPEIYFTEIHNHSQGSCTIM